MKQSTLIALQALLFMVTQRGLLAAELIDPTRPIMARPVTTSAATPIQAASELKLEAILLSNDRRLAIVNGKLLRVGDRLGDTRIEAITAAAIRYSRAGRSHTLQLAQPTIKVRRSAASYEAKR